MLRVPMILFTGFSVLFGISACSQSKAPQAADRPPTNTTVKPEAVDPIEKESAVDAQKLAAPRIDALPGHAPKNDGVQRKVPPQIVHRPDDRRVPRDEAKLAEVGIQVFQSKRLKLYTDIDTELTRTLPALIDQLYVAWEDYFGPLPPDRAGTDFQMSGYMMREIALFREFGLVPEGLFVEHGRHAGNEFWLQDQPSDYYRRHQVIHEATHCFMTCMPDSMGPVWYMEGMAECFASHRLDREHRATFRVMPSSQLEFAYFDRITLIREEVAQGKCLTIPAIFEFQPVEFRTVHYYAWSWALSTFLDQTSRYHDRFQQLGRVFPRSHFAATFDELFELDRRELATEWTLFATNLMYGYDTIRTAIDFRPGTELTDRRTIQVEADRGWQSSGVLVEKGQMYKISATGQFVLANDPKPWISEPQGISFRYFDGRPLGMLVGCLRTEDGPAGGEDESMLRTFAIGRDHLFPAPASGTLYLRLNEAWNSLHDNHGHADVSIEVNVTP